MTAEPGTVELTAQDLRAVTAFAAARAEPVLGLFEAGRPDDSRPREAIEAAWAFTRGGERGHRLECARPAPAQRRRRHGRPAGRSDDRGDRAGP
ncbi:putative immunity protein [Streptomyces sp. NPDC059166]|uniref:putative immunity protein n=1 Tax=Streptomyces sp. NPDC059166 TaxID=3346752 RepID=UPI0036B3867C